MKIKYPILLLFYISGCTSPSKEVNTPTSGNITISVDESLKPLVQAEIETFTNLYRYTEIKANYKSEYQAFRDLISNQARLIIVSRNLKENEIDFFKTAKIVPRVTKIATDALALIIHKENTDTAISLNQLRDIFTGKIKHWNEINSKSVLDEIQIVFDHGSSGAIEYIKQNISNNEPLPLNSFGANSNEAVITHISKNKNALGIIGVSWISDVDDTTSGGFLKKINVVAVSSKQETEEENIFYKPYQAYIAQGLYPLCRDVYIISREARSGLGTGLTAFVASDKGQRIVLKSGLVPATMPIRIINLNEN